MAEQEKSKEQKPQKSQKIILQQTQEAALTQMDRRWLGLGLSGFSAGLDIGFSVLAMSVMITLFRDSLPEPLVHVLVSNMYPLGFIFVILGRSELFTEHTTLAVLPVMQKLASFKKLVRLWGIVYISNIIGGLVFAFLLYYLAASGHLLSEWALKEVSASMLEYSWKTLLLGSIMAGWMMGLLAWLLAASRETISQIALIWIVTASIGFADLPHCIVGNIEIASSLFQGQINFVEYISTLAPVTLGNIVGGVLFVGILKFSHTIRSGEEKDLDDNPEMVR